MLKILGLGNALVDIMIMLPNDELLIEKGLPKGSMHHVGRSVVDDLLLRTLNLKRELTSGGSAANAIHGLARLGISTAFIGKIGPDDLGNIFYLDMINSGISPQLLHTSTETGTAVAFITPDSERTFAVFLGAALELTASDLLEDHFKGFDLLHIEGYLAQNHHLIKTAVKMAKAAGMKVSLDLASYNVVEDNLEFLHGIVKNYVDIVFANEEEASAFTGLEPELAVSSLALHCEVAIVKTGAKGSLIKSGESLYTIGIIPTTVIDSTGAGDLYAAGFLHGYLNKLPLQKCGQAGAILSGNVIRHIGAKIPAEFWPGIIAEIENL
ncbi:MAG: adenosine kinase [Bacteroidales bacterium]|nr:adenosine kinase [Bacteroidales bacterium]